MNIKNKTVTIAGAPCYHAYPDDGGKHPGLILIEEVWGVDVHIKSVADRFAAEGFSVIAPELLPAGVLEIVTPQMKLDLFDPEKRNAVQPKMREAMQPIMQPEYAKGALAILRSCVDHLLADGHVDGSVGVLGFCFGGTYSFHLAAHDPRVKVAVPFYGHAPSPEEITDITCPVLAFYGDQDAMLMATLDELKTNMKKEDKDFEAVVYPGAGHAFFNDTNPRAYRADAAKDAWEKLLPYLKDHLAA